MTTTRTSQAESPPDDDMRPEYPLDYAKAQPNRFAGRVRPGSRVVVLDPDVAEFFTTPEQVAALLRAVIATVPAHKSGDGAPRESDSTMKWLAAGILGNCQCRTRGRMHHPST